MSKPQLVTLEILYTMVRVLNNIKLVLVVVEEEEEK